MPTLDKAENLPYPSISTSQDSRPQSHDGSGHEKKVALELNDGIADADAIARMALDAAEKGAKVLVIRNLHASALATAEAMFRISPDHPTLFRCNGVPTLHHGRFAPEDRELLDAVIDEQMKRGRGEAGLVLVGTQTLEQSLDICADLIITDLAPADVLLQRIGRLHRHAENPRPSGFENPRAIVLSPDDLTPLLARGGFGLGGKYGPYRDLVMLEATRRLIAKFANWDIPAMNRMLVEGVTHPEALEKLAGELSLTDKRWCESRQDIEGSVLGDASVAIAAGLDWRKSFSDDKNSFPSDEKLATRLGASDLAIELPEVTLGPFGKSIRRITIPSYWLSGIDLAASVEPIIVPIESGIMTIKVQQLEFRYDRFGLRKAV